MRRPAAGLTHTGGKKHTLTPEKVMKHIQSCTMFSTYRPLKWSGTRTKTQGDAATDAPDVANPIIEVARRHGAIIF